MKKNKDKSRKYSNKDIFLNAFYIIFLFAFLMISNSLFYSNTQPKMRISTCLPNSTQEIKVSFNIYEVPISNNNINLVCNISITTMHILSYELYDNFTIIGSGLIENSEILQINQSIYENGIHNFNFYLTNETADLIFSTTIPYLVQSFTITSPPQNEILSNIGFGTLIIVPIIIIYLIYKYQQKFYKNALKDKKKLFVSDQVLEKRDFSVLGYSNSHFSKIINSSIIIQEELIQYLRECANIIDFRLYQDKQEIYRSSPQLDLFNQIKPRIFKQYFDQIFQNTIQSNSPDKFESNFITCYGMVWRFEPFTLSIIHLQNPDHFSKLFKDTIQSFLTEMHNMKTMNAQLLVEEHITFTVNNFFNIQLASLISVPNLSPSLLERRMKIAEQIYNCRGNINKIQLHEIIQDITAFDNEELHSLEKIMHNFDQSENSEFDVDFEEDQDSIDPNQLFTLKKNVKS